MRARGCGKGGDGEILQWEGDKNNSRIIIIIIIISIIIIITTAAAAAMLGQGLVGRAALRSPCGQ